MTHDVLHHATLRRRIQLYAMVTYEGVGSCYPDSLTTRWLSRGV